MDVPPELHSPPASEHFDSGFVLVRKILRMALVYGLAAIVAIAVFKPSTLLYAAGAAVLVVMIYATVVTRLRQRFDAASAEIAARGSRPYSPGDFSDEDDWSG